MKILSLSEENVKRLSAVELELGDKGNLVIVAGNNEQGKSSLLDGIEMALHGGASIPAKPVRRGQERATVEITLGEIGLPELTVKRTMTSTGGGALIVTNKDGARLTSPQAILDALVGKLSFDPLGFVKMKADDRAKTLQQLMALDFKAKDLEKEKLYDRRTEVNRTVKAKTAMLAANPLHSDVPAEEVSAAEILDLQKEAADSNAANAEKRSAFKSLCDSLGRLVLAVEEQERSCEQTRLVIKEAQKRLVGQEEHLSSLKAQRDAKATSADSEKQKIGELKDTDLAPFRQRISDVEATNLKIRKNAERKKISDDLKTAEFESSKLSKAIDAIEREKRDAIAAAKFPLPGMSLGDAGEVLLDGLPFEQASTKGQLMASLAMGAALNPKLRVLLVRSGNDLDDTAMKVLAEWSEANNMQVWIERISRSGKVAVIIEDGRAVGEAQPELVPA